MSQTAIIELHDAQIIALRRYLLSHEADIAVGINDFGDLLGVFAEMFGRPPVYSLPRPMEVTS